MLLNAQPIEQEGDHVRLILLAIEDVTAFREAQRLREDYVSIVSHDLRNPLANIIGFAELLKRALVKQELQKEAANAEAILASARRMNAMIQDLVETTRLESGQIELHKHPLSLDSLVAGDTVLGTLTIADFAVAPVLFRSAALPIDLDAYPRLAQLRASLTSRPSFTAAEPVR
jgi:signal transduction histidine kinase